MCLRSHGIDDDGGGVGGGQGIYDASEGSETAAYVVGTIHWAQGIYDNNGGVGRGRREQRLPQQQRRRRRRIDDASKGSETTMEAAADRRQAWCIGNDNGLLIVFAMGLLTVTLFCLYLFAVSFFFFIRFLFFRSLQEILSVMQSCGKYSCTKCTLTLRMYPLRTGE